MSCCARGCPGCAAWARCVSRCRQLLDLDADACAIGAALAADDLLAPLVAARPGLRVPGTFDGFELAARAVLGQQVSVLAARTLAGRLADRFGARLETAEGPPSVLFPGPAEVADADLSGLGLTTARQATLRALAAAVADGTLELDHGADPQETAARLAELPGVGPWTISYILMRAVRDPDAFPAADLGLRRALEQTRRHEPDGRTAGAPGAPTRPFTCGPGPRAGRTRTAGHRRLPDRPTPVVWPLSSKASQESHVTNSKEQPCLPVPPARSW